MTYTTGSTQNSVNHKLALPQVKTTNYSITYKIAKPWDSVLQNSLKPSFANNFVSSKKLLKHSRTFTQTQIIQLLYDTFI